MATSEPFIAQHLSSIGKDGRDDEELLLLESRDASKPENVQQSGDKISGRSLVIINSAAGLDGCDDQMLPASFRAMEHELHFTPSLLGKITLAQSLSLALACPIWGILADKIDRKRMLQLGCTCWGIVTIGLSAASNFWHVIVLRMLNGFFMASIGPISQSILADASKSEDRGLVFGLIQTCSNFGRVIGGVVTSAIGLQYFYGIAGWRYSIATVGILSIILGLVIGAFLPTIKRRDYNSPQRYLSLNSSSIFEDVKANQKGGHFMLPPDTGGLSHSIAGESRQALSSIEDNGTLKDFLRELSAYSLRQPSVWLLVLEGMAGMIPWSALSFTTMFFQYCGLSDLQAGLVTGGMLVGAMISGPIGGFLGDLLAQKAPNHGRPLMAQFSVIIRLPILIACFHQTKKAPSSILQFSVLALALGLCSFAGAAVNRPILSDVALARHRATVFSLAIALEGAFAAIFGAPLVGWMAERQFGYRHSTLQFWETPTEELRHNANALGKAMVYLTTIPWAVSFFIYAGLHFTYGKDKRRAAVRTFLGAYNRK